jgi:hypothetical protein
MLIQCDRMSLRHNETLFFVFRDVAMLVSKRLSVMLPIFLQVCSTVARPICKYE